MNLRSYGGMQRISSGVVFGFTLLFNSVALLHLGRVRQDVVDWVGRR